MTTFALELNPQEIKTRELFNAVLEGDKKSVARVIVARVFINNYSKALSADRVCDIATPEENLISSDRIRGVYQTTLSQFVREGVLRSRVNQFGKRLYEVNF